MEVLVTPAGNLFTGQVRPALCLDLDGTIRHSKADPKGFIRGPEDVSLFPDVEARLWEYRRSEWLIFGISNQGSVAHGFKTVAQCQAELDATISLFAENPFHIIKMCYHDRAGSVFPYNHRSLCRKPDIGLLVMMEGLAWEANFIVDWDASLFVGDRPEDKECAARAGIPFISHTSFFNREQGQL